MKNIYDEFYYWVVVDFVLEIHQKFDLRSEKIINNKIEIGGGLFSPG